MNRRFKWVCHPTLGVGFSTSLGYFVYEYRSRLQSEFFVLYRKWTSFATGPFVVHRPTPRVRRALKQHRLNFRRTHDRR